MTSPLTREQIRAIDQLAVDRYHIPGLILMENAGKNAARAIDRRFGPGGRTLIVCGVGNNGGDGCVIARHLHNAGWEVRLVVVGDESKMSPDMAANFAIVRAMGLDFTVAPDAARQAEAVTAVSPDDVVIDALLGTGFRGEVREPLARLIHGLNGATKRAVVAVDVPSGLECDAGQPSSATIHADLTVTFVASKVGFTSPAARPYLGEVEVVDIGAPRALVDGVARGESFSK